jgi:hypothetical protein
MVGLDQHALSILGVAVLAESVQRLGEPPDSGMIVVLLQQFSQFFGRSLLEQTRRQPVVSERRLIVFQGQHLSKDLGCPLVLAESPESVCRSKMEIPIISLRLFVPIDALVLGRK